jgi:hypothetical protein
MTCMAFTKLLKNLNLLEKKPGLLLLALNAL